MTNTIAIDAVLRDMVTPGLKSIESSINKATAKFTSINKVLNDISAEQVIREDIMAPLKQSSSFAGKLQQNFKKVQNTLLGLGLSMLFTGMALKRVVDSALRAIFTTAQLAYGEVSEFNVLTNQLRANWEFFKFTLVEALMQSGLFQMFIGFLISIINWFSSLNPTTKRFIVIMLVGLSLVTGLMMVLGQAALALLAPLALVGTGGALAMSMILWVAGTLLAAFVLLSLIWSSNMSTANKWATTVLTIFGAALVIGATLGGALGVVIVLIGALVAGLVYLWKNWDDIWGNMKVLAIRVLYEVLRYFENMVNDAISMINFLIRGINKIPGVNISQIGNVDFTSGARDLLLSQIQAENARRSGNSTSSQSNTFVINQQPGESTDGLVERIMEEINATADRFIPATQQG